MPADAEPTLVEARPVGADRRPYPIHLHRLDLDLDVPNRGRVHRRARSLELPRMRSGTKPVHLLVDSTGLPLCGPGDELVERHGGRACRM